MVIEKEEKRERDEGHKQEQKGEIEMLHVFPLLRFVFGCKWLKFIRASTIFGLGLS